jgi:hypothetical protein
VHSETLSQKTKKKKKKKKGKWWGRREEGKHLKPALVT